MFENVEPKETDKRPSHFNRTDTKANVAEHTYEYADICQTSKTIRIAMRFECEMRCKARKMLKLQKN